MRIISLLLSAAMAAGTVSGVSSAALAEELNEEAAVFLESEEAPAGWEELLGEGQPLSEEAAPEQRETESGYPWLTMTDEEFAAFILQEAFRDWQEDPDAMESILERLEQVADAQVREMLEAFLANANPAEAADFEVMAAGATADQINDDEMFFKQSVGGTCTLAANAMMVRRAARLNGYSDWRSVTEDAIRDIAWIDGVGMVWNYSYAGITVGHGYFNKPTEETVAAMLRDHPEGIVAYCVSAAGNRGNPHAVLLTDYTDGTFYCSDPGYDAGRKPLEWSLLATGKQANTVASFTAYWYVTSPKLSIAPVLPFEESPVQLATVRESDGSVTLKWDYISSAAGYNVYRAVKPDGPFTEPIYKAVGTTATHWNDTTGTPLQSYYYCVVPFNASLKEGMRSNVVTFIPDRTVAHVADGSCGNGVRWALYNDNILLISGDGAMIDYNYRGAPWYPYYGRINEVVICGGVTKIGSNAFYGCAAMKSLTIPETVTVIGVNAFRDCSGISDVELPAGVTVGSNAFTGTGVNPGQFGIAQVYGNSLTLNGDIGLNFYLILPEALAADSEAYATLNGTKVMLSRADKVNSSGQTLYRLQYNVASPEMGVKIALRLFDGTGKPVTLMRNSEDVTGTYAYSVEDYYKAAASNGQDKLKALMDAMVNYGYYSQQHFGSGVPLSAPAGFSTDVGDLSAYEPKFTGTLSGLTYKGSSVVLESTTTIKHYFTLEAGENAADYSVTVNGAKANLEVSGSTCVVRIANVAAPQLGSTFRVVVSKGGESMTVDYSAFSYVYAATQSSAASASLVSAVRALYCYGVAAKSYFG